MEAKEQVMTSSRNFSLDLVRCFALLSIFINHIPGNFFESFTLKNFGFSDSTELFVLVSGLVVGLCYYPRFENGQRVVCLLRLWRRAGILYCAHILCSFTTLLIFSSAALLTSTPSILQMNNIDVFMNDTARAISGMGLLSHQLGYNNILSLYFILFLLAPFILYGLRFRFWFTIFISFFIWFTAGVWQIAPFNYPSEGFWFLNPFSWQFLFVVGIALSIGFQSYKKVILSPFLVCFSFIYLVFSFLLVRSSLWGYDSWFGWSPFLAGFDKTFLSVSRLVHILSLSCLITYSRVLPVLIRFTVMKPLILVGKYSLPVFLFGTILAMIGQVLCLTSISSFTRDVILLPGGLALQVLFVLFMEYISRFRISSVEASSP